MPSDAAHSTEAGAHPRSAPLPFDPVGKTRYTAEEIHALFEGLSPPTEDDRTVLAAHPGRPATREELMAFVEELWALHKAENEDATG